jgi:ornithine cyclodeaminase
MDCAQEDECGEAFICFVIPCCDASELFEIAEEVLDEMPPAIHGEITRNEVLAIRFRRNDGLDFLFAEQLAQTDVRTAAAGAVAAKLLSREDASIATIFGAGVQARLQLQALTLVRPIREVRIWARDRLKAEALVEQLKLEHSLPVVAFADPKEAVSGSHIIVTTTPADRPILDASWLEPGQHVTAMGSDAEHKNEIDPAAIARADVYVADSLKQTRRLGELHHAIAAGLFAADTDFPELGQIIAGGKAGRIRDADITIADLTGTGVQDTAIATLAFQRAEERNAGKMFES